MPTSAASGNILLYTSDINNNKLEAYIFEDAVNPIVFTTSSMTPTVTSGSATV